MTKFTSLTASALVALLVICLSSAIYAQDPYAGLTSKLPLPTTTPSGTDSSDAGPTGSAPTDSATPSPSASGAPYGSVAGAPTGTGSLIPAWSSALGKYSTGAAPSALPTPSGSGSGSGTTASAPPTAGASKIENGLISGVIIAGIVSLFF